MPGKSFRVLPLRSLFERLRGYTGGSNISGFNGSPAFQEHAFYLRKGNVDLKLDLWKIDAYTVHNLPGAGTAYFPGYSAVATPDEHIAITHRYTDFPAAGNG